MQDIIRFIPLSKEKFDEAVEVVLRTELDTREEIEHHLEHIDAHFIALERDKIIGVIGWYQDNVHYADKAMGEDFPGEDAYWVGFFAVEEKYRRKGVGYALLQKLEQVVKHKNLYKLWVSSVPETRKYYYRQGFRLFKKGKIRGNLRYFLLKTIS